VRQPRRVERRKALLVFLGARVLAPAPPVGDFQGDQLRHERRPLGLRHVGQVVLDAGERAASSHGLEHVLKAVAQLAEVRRHGFQGAGAAERGWIHEPASWSHS
jgi:hypothetical protein